MEPVRWALDAGPAQVARDLGVGPEALRLRVRCVENCRLRRANEILKSASLFFARELDTRPRPSEMPRHIDEHRTWAP